MVVLRCFVLSSCILVIIITYSDFRKVNELLVNEIFNLSYVVGQNETKPRENLQKNVLLWAHGRSGSKFVATVLASGRKTYFMEEPVHSGVGDTFDHPEKVPRALSQLSNCLRCKFSDEIDMMERQSLHLGHFDREPTLKYLCSSDLGLRDYCQSNIEALEVVCQAARRRVFRIIALRFQHVRKLLEDSSLNVNIVHLIRDPVAVVSSSLKISNSYKDLHNVKQFCQTVNDEIKYVNQISASYPNRYLIVRYEDVAKFPIKMYRKIFAKLGFPFTVSVMFFIRKITSRSSQESGYHDDLFGTQRISRTSYDGWRQTIPFNLSRIIQEECKPALEFGRYTLFQNEADLRNKSIRSFAQLRTGIESPFLSPFRNGNIKMSTRSWTKPSKNISSNLFNSLNL